MLNRLIYLLPLCILTALQGDTLEVCHEGCAYKNIQLAINAANDGDQINVGPGYFKGGINTLGKAITISGTSYSDGGATYIDANYEGPGITCNSGETWDTQMYRLRVINGVGYKGGGAFISNSSPYIAACTFSHCKAMYGGGMYIEGGHPLIASFFKYNKAE